MTLEGMEALTGNFVDREAQELDRDILALIGEGALAPRSDARFNALAMRLFAYQFERNGALRGFCAGREMAPSAITHWTQIPAVPTMAFKELSLACFPIERAQAVYVSSGTSGAKRSRHFLESLDLYHASLLANFKACMLPDRSTMRILVLGPPGWVLPQSSLTHMFEEVMAQLGAPGSSFLVDEGGLQKDRAMKALKTAEDEGSPVCLLGTAFAFVHLLDYCREQRVRFALPDGSRIMDTGGFKGKSREVPRAELMALYQATFGVPGERVINEYGMTEMGSQFYDSAMALPTAKPRRKVVPPWVRTIVVDPETMRPAPEGATGLLRHYDLANRSSVMAIQTDDLGVQIGEGFEIIGRATGAEARGCSIAMDELLSRSG